LSDTSKELQMLIERCNRGDRHAWEDLYGRYIGIISAAVRRQCAKDPSQMDDMCQDVFVSLFQALKSYDPARSIEAYILEIIRRIRIDRFRKDSAAKRGGNNPSPRPLNMLDEEDERGYVTVASPHDNQEASLIKAQESQLLRRALDAISEHCRTLLGLRYENGLSFNEISLKLGIKEVTLRSQVQRCLSSLSQHYHAAL
jgi:RNA polymerase sigma-70 factor, ECF subfamily